MNPLLTYEYRTAPDSVQTLIRKVAELREAAPQEREDAERELFEALDNVGK